MAKPQIASADMIFKLFDDSFEHGERARFDQLLGLLKDKRPELYAARGVTYLSFRINNALVAGHVDSLPALVHELGEIGETDIDAFNRTLSQLAYRGQLELLRDARRTAWPHVMGEAMARMSGRKTTAWTLEDFKLDRPGAVRRRRRDDDDEDDVDPCANERLIDLCYEFMGYARREAGIPWPRVSLGREHLIRYIIDRHAGRLEEDMMQGMIRVVAGKARPNPPHVANVLCPDMRSLDSYLAGLLSPLNAAPMAAAALFMLMPTWLHFLESGKLIDAARRSSTLQSIAPLADSMATILTQWGEDPLLAEDMRHWRDLERVAGT